VDKPGENKMSNTDIDAEIKVTHLKPNNAYGQNGSPLPSSLTPGQTKSPIADVSPPQADVPGLDANAQLSNRVSPDAAPIPVAHGMKSPAAPDKIGGGNVHQPSKRAMGGNFQR
jgi:hypothetical protein